MNDLGSSSRNQTRSRPVMQNVLLGLTFTAGMSSLGALAGHAARTPTAGGAFANELAAPAMSHY